MGVRQLEEFLGQADQKGLWIFTYANLGGGFIGAFLGNSLMERLAPAIPFIKLLGILLAVLLGVTVTWKVKGYPIHRWVLSYIAFVLRRYAKIGLGDPTIDAGLYYRARAAIQDPFMLVTTRGGRPIPVLVHRGSRAGSSPDPSDGLLAASLVPSLAPPLVEGVERSWPAAGLRSHEAYTAGMDPPVGAPGSRSISSNGRSLQLATVGEQLALGFADWEL